MNDIEDRFIIIPLIRDRAVSFKDITRNKLACILWDSELGCMIGITTSWLRSINTSWSLYFLYLQIKSHICSHIFNCLVWFFWLRAIFADFSFSLTRRSKPFPSFSLIMPVHNEYNFIISMGTHYINSITIRCRQW